MIPENGQEHAPLAVAEQCRAVLSVWMEKRTVEQVCQELGIRRPAFMQWQDRAMAGMIRALSPRAQQEERKPVLAVMVRRLVERQIAEQGGTPARLAKRLAVVTAARESPAGTGEGPR